MENNLYDVIIIGGGPAGLTSALYLSRAKYRVLVIEKNLFGGQITITAEVVNYPGIEKISGTQLTETMHKQAQNFGAEFLLAEVESISTNNDIKIVNTNKGEIKGLSVLLATGTTPRTVGFKNEDKFRGHGITYCATCDGEFFTDKDIFVIGGGFSAAQESLFLTKYAKSVTILIRGDDFKCPLTVADTIRSNNKITVLTNTVVDEVDGDSVLRSIKYHNTKTGEKSEYTAKKDDTFGIFIFVGYQPETSLIKNIATLDNNGYAIADNNLKTNIDGLYVAGDVRVKDLRQVVTATGDGALVATKIEPYISEMHKKTGIVPKQKQSKTLQESDNKFFDSATLQQLNTVLSKIKTNLTLKLYLDEREVSNDLKNYMLELTKLTDKLSFEISNDNDKNLPVVKICNSKGEWTGLSFHGVPMGHELNPFILGLYNASSLNQEIEPDILTVINNIDKDINIKVIISLSCIMCPELVVAAQHIASLNPLITAEIYDIKHFPELKSQYNIMSVPCLVVDDKISFGKKNIRQVIEFIT